MFEVSRKPLDVAHLTNFQQILSNQAQTIALKYYPASLRAQYVAAASNFRIPYVVLFLGVIPLL